MQSNDPVHLASRSAETDDNTEDNMDDNAPGREEGKPSAFACDLHPPTPLAYPTRLLLVCHAENMQRRHLHLTPNETGLSAKGWEQSTALAQWLHAHEEIDNLLTDSRLSARLTAQRIGQQLGLRLQTIPDFPQGSELSWALRPPLPGGTAPVDLVLSNEAPTELGAATRTATSTGAGAAPESHFRALTQYSAYSEQLTASLARLLLGKWGMANLLVADGAAIATLLRSFAAGSRLGVAVSHTSISEVVYRDGYWSLAYANRVEHLTRPSVAPRSIPQEQLSPAATHPNLTIESEKLAAFYDRVVLSLEEKAKEAPQDEQPASISLNADMSAEQIRTFAGLEDNCRLLLVGAGSGQGALSLAQTGIGEVVGIDVSPIMLERAELLRLNATDERLRQVNFRLAAVHDLPFRDGRFDAALCVHLLHHLANPGPALQELRRVLTPSGKLILIDIDGSPDAVRRATQNAIESKRNPTHAATRTKERMAAMLNENGFQVEKEQHWRVQRSVHGWLDGIAVSDSTRLAVTEMLEASIETNAADLHARRQNGDLLFDAPIVAFVARTNAVAATDTARAG